MIVLNLARGKGTMRVPLHLPASGSAVKRAFDLLQETTGKGVTRIDSVTGPVPNLGNYLTHIDISDPDEREKEAVFRVLLWSETMREQKVEPYPLELPAIPERLSEAKRAIGIAEFPEVAIVQAETMLPELRERLPVQCDDVELLNDLDRRIMGMRKVEGAYQKFLAVLDVEEPATPDSANELAKSLDDYTLFAVFPEKLIEPCILAGCPEGGTVLDPFCGSGTTGVVAKKLRRDFIGIELNPQYRKMAEERIAAVPDQLSIFEKEKQ